MKLLPVLGLMSGTSMDGIDGTILFTDGNNFERSSYNSITPYKKQTKLLLTQAYQNPLKFINNKSKMKILTNLVTIDHARAVKKLMSSFNKKIELVGFHGQTIFHDPIKKYSIQIGDGLLLSRLVKSDVIYQFRKGDLNAGGQGAPIAPVYHQSIIKKLSLSLPAIIINIGGISNLTYWDGKNLIGFDTGPGNNLMDKYLQDNLSMPFDFNGDIAKSGKPDLKIAEGYCNLKFYQTPFPKSLDRLNLFQNPYYNKVLNLKNKDAVSTLCYITLKSIQKSFKLLPFTPKVTIITGGGSNNMFLVNLLKNNIPGKVLTAAEVNIPGDYMEAELISYLAARQINNFPSTFPSTTGSSKPIVCGVRVKY
jgi:anhydro-N-acetylmuramic acid kinase